jgi:hypothetical protein
MPTIAKLVVRLTLNDSQYKKGLDSAVKQSQAAEKRVSQSTQKTADKVKTNFTNIDTVTRKVSQSFGSGSPLIRGIQSFGSKLATQFPAIGKFGSALGGGLSKAAGMAKSAFGIISKGAVAVGSGLAVAGTAVIGFGALVTGAAWNLAKAAIPMEGIQNAFRGLSSTFQGGSQAMLSALQQSTAGMVTNTELMRQYNLAAQLVGQEFAQNLPAAMGPIQKVATATGQDIGFLMNSLTVGIGRLSPMILDNLGVQVDLTQAYADFADKNGLVASSLTKTQQQMALMDQVIQKMNDNTANIPTAFGSAAQVFGAFRTSLANVKDQMGLDLLPTFTSLFSMFQKFTPLISSFGSLFTGTFAGLGNVAKSFVSSFASGLGIDMENLGGNMESWGANIVTQLAAGMAKAIGAVISVLNTLGQVIAGWLAPGSPPKLLPDLPAWGENATNWFLKGMTNGNISILRDLSGQVESFLRSSMAGQSSESIAKAVLAARGGMESALAGGSNMLKAVPEGVRGYAGALISSQQAAEKLAKAQDNLNKITKQYDEQLKPITGRLKEIQAERDAFTQQQRIGELNQIVTDATASGDTDAVRFAQLELEEIALQNQQSAIEENRDAAVDAATQKVDAAQAEMDAAEKRLELERELLQHQIETNNLLADTISKLDGMSAAGGAAGAAGAMASLEESMAGIGNIAAPLGSTMSELAESIMGQFDGIGSAAGELGQTWAGVASGLIERAGNVVAWWQTNFGEGGVWPGIMDMASKIFQSQWGEGGTWEGNMKNLQKIGQALADWWLEIWGEDGVWAGIMENATTIFNEQWDEGGVWSGIADNMQLIISYIKDEFEQKLDLINDKVLKAKEFIHNLLEKAQEFYDWIKDKVFDFKITWPELPEWMQTNSPMVLHTRAKDFKRFLDGSTFDFDIQSNDLEGVTNNMLDHAALATAGANVNQPFNMYGNVNNGMSERELETKVRRWIKDENRKR